MPSYRFDRYELVPESRRLIHDGRDLVVGLRVFDVITYLVENRHRVIGRDELIAAVWGRTDAGEALLAQAVLKARRAFGDDGNAQHHIRTVPRFGYQWVAETQPVDPAIPDPTSTANEQAGGAGDDPVAKDAAPAEVRLAAVGENVPADASRRSGRYWTIAVISLLLTGLALALTIGRKDIQSALPSSSQGGQASLNPVVGLILVVPTQVQSTVAEDGWMRLGVMSLSAQTLADVAGHAVVPDETALAAVAQAGSPFDIERLRAETGATLVVTSEASRVGSDWILSATVFGPEGHAQMVEAKAADPVVAAGALARNLHDLLAPRDGHDEGESLPPDVLALNARMKAAILDGQNGRALALFDAAPQAATAPTAILLRAEALIQLGRTEEAASALRALIDKAIAGPVPRWLPGAWSALGDCELALGHPSVAETHFRRSLELLGTNGDRRTSGMAWRGLGIAQVVRNDLDGAEASYLHARFELESIGDRLILARITDGLGYLAAHRGRMADALLLYEQAAAMGAIFGFNEVELGSQLNIAEAQRNLLRHGSALDKIRALLPRIRNLDYPALHRFGLVTYAAALADTGALAAAREELTGLAVENRANIEHDAVVDVRLDEARVRLAIGDAAGSIRQIEALRATLDSDSVADLRLEATALLLRAYMDNNDTAAARVLIADAASWSLGNALAPARVHALVAQAQWQALQGDGSLAEADYRQAFGLAREFGTPLLLRDAAVPYAEFLLSRGALDDARATANVLGPYAEEDFAIALLLARLVVANHDPALARSYFARARKLAGERWTAEFESEESAAAGTRQ
jgi:DNA-binding winged helix-turn-helix (wHTH) protein/tetratricopeptide (TPR) repeat protein